MKNKFILIALLAIGITSISSCYTSKSKVGCPAYAYAGNKLIK